MPRIVRCHHSEDRPVTTSASHLDKAFVEAQRQRLLQLRAELLRTTDAVGVEETDLQNRFVEDAQEREDDSQRLNILENDGALALRNMDRVRAVERALTISSSHR